MQSNGGENKFLDKAVHGNMDGDLAIGAGFCNEVEKFAGKLFPDIGFGTVALYFVKENVAHLVVASQVFYFVHQLILCHREVPPLMDYIIP